MGFPSQLYRIGVLIPLHNGSVSAIKKTVLFLYVPLMMDISQEQFVMEFFRSVIHGSSSIEISELQ